MCGHGLAGFIGGLLVFYAHVGQLMTKLGLDVVLLCWCPVLVLGFRVSCCSAWHGLLRALAADEDCTGVF